MNWALAVACAGLALIIVFGVILRRGRRVDGGPSAAPNGSTDEDFARAGFVPYREGEPWGRQTTR